MEQKSFSADETTVLTITGYGQSAAGRQAASEQPVVADPPEEAPVQRRSFVHRDRCFDGRPCVTLELDERLKGQGSAAAAAVLRPEAAACEPDPAC